MHLAAERRDDAVRFRVRLVLSALLALGVAYLAFGPKPWNAGVAEKLALGRNPKILDYAISTLWWAALANVGLLAAALASLRYWLRTDPAPPRPAFAAPPRLGAAFWLAVAGSVFTLAALAAPRLSQSLWDDEVRNVRSAIDGYYEVDADGGVAFRPVGWIDTLWHYRQPNNHVPYSILARLATRAWQPLVGERRVSEPILRMPAFLAGLASLVASALLLWRLGYPRAGVVAAWTLALHPWVLRYASEARGYAFVLLLVPTVALLLLRALELGSWRRWLAFGSAQLLLLWMNPGALPWVAVLNLVTPALLWHAHRDTGTLAPQGARWLAACLAGAALFVSLTAPTWPQLLAFLERFQASPGALGGRWLANVGGYFLAGTPWHHQGPGPDYPRLEDVAAVSGASFWLAVACAAGFAALGVARLLRAGGHRAAFVPLFLLPGPATWLLAVARGSDLHEWYLLFALPGLVSLFAVGLAGTMARWRGVGGAAGTAVLATAVLGLLASVGAPAREALRGRSLQPIRESVELTRPLHAPFLPDQSRVLTASLRTATVHYDPFIHYLQGGSELRQLMQEADASGRALFVNLPPFRLEKSHPDIALLLLDPEQFERVALLHGFEPRLSRAVYRYRSPAARRGGR